MGFGFGGAETGDCSAIVVLLNYMIWVSTTFPLYNRYLNNSKCDCCVSLTIVLLHKSPHFAFEHRRQ